MNPLSRQVRQGQFARVLPFALVFPAILWQLVPMLREPVLRENRIRNRPVQGPSGSFVSSDSIG
jgi:hypothetical protein